MQIIFDKINPPLEAPRLSRVRLLNALRASLASCTSTVISGRAGSGKTLLAGDFARSCGRRTSWYKVEGADGNLRVFFQYLVACVRARRSGFGQKSLIRLGEVTSVEEVPLLAEAFVYELLEAEGDPLLIVLEDLHRIYDAQWTVPFFRRLLPLLPADAHMVITGRTLPPAPLWRMRSKQTLCIIDEILLAFTLEEVKRLFAIYGLPEAQACSALEQTHGRAAPLERLALLMSTRRRLADNAVRDVDGNRCTPLGIITQPSPEGTTI
jgi:LuxR family transcriptional regulator, maltose regulon positive regulatory protein